MATETNRNEPIVTIHKKSKLNRTIFKGMFIFFKINVFPFFINSLPPSGLSCRYLSDFKILTLATVSERPQSKA